MTLKPKWNSEEIKKFYSQNRNDWDQLYNSEKYILERSNISFANNILDVGCACAGLYKILKKKFFIKNYFGIDINQQCIKFAKQQFFKDSKVNLISGDILKMKYKLNKKFSFVISFGYIDCSYDFYKSFEECLKYLEPDGSFIFDIRLTNEEELIDIKNSFQYLNYDGKKIGEKIPYNIINFKKFTNYLNTKYPNCDYLSYGYDLSPSSNAVLKYKKITFATWILKKNGNSKRINILPENLLKI